MITIQLSVIYTYLEKEFGISDITSEKVKYITGVNNLFIRTKRWMGILAVKKRNFENLLNNLTSSKKIFWIWSKSANPES